VKESKKKKKERKRESKKERKKGRKEGTKIEKKRGETTAAHPTNPDLSNLKSFKKF
jgi:hypothetical protein